MNNIEFYELPNIGVLSTQLPSNLYSKLLNECLEAEHNNKNFQTGLTGSGVPTHYFVKDTENELKHFVGTLAQNYFDKYPQYLSGISILSKNCQLTIDTPWINLQKKHEYLPNHKHDGVLSYSIWIKIPYDEEKERNQKQLKFGNQKFYSFEFSYLNILGQSLQHNISVTKKEEGIIQMFPSQLIHAVYPFYTSDEYRISVSGNIKFKVE